MEGWGLHRVRVLPNGGLCVVEQKIKRVVLAVLLTVFVICCTCVVIGRHYMR
jgi:hypothetical protein